MRHADGLPLRRLLLLFAVAIQVEGVCGCLRVGKRGAEEGGTGGRRYEGGMAEEAAGRVAGTVMVKHASKEGRLPRGRNESVHQMAVQLFTVR